MQNLAVQIISTCPTAPFSEQVKIRYQKISERWEALCKELGINFKKVEEVLFSLQLFEAMLSRLNNWLKGVEEKAEGLSAKLNDRIEAEQRLIDLKVFLLF